MGFIDTLMATADEDTRLLLGHDGRADDFSVSREVDFLLHTPDRERAETLVEFINSNQYGEATLSIVDDVFRVLIVINMPPTQNVLCSVSAFMACLAVLFRSITLAGNAASNSRLDGSAPRVDLRVLNLPSLAAQAGSYLR